MLASGADGIKEAIQGFDDAYVHSPALSILILPDTFLAHSHHSHIGLDSGTNGYKDVS